MGSEAYPRMLAAMAEAAGGRAADFKWENCDWPTFGRVMKAAVEDGYCPHWTDDVAEKARQAFHDKQTVQQFWAALKAGATFDEDVDDLTRRRAARARASTGERE